MFSHHRFDISETRAAVNLHTEKTARAADRSSSENSYSCSVDKVAACPFLLDLTIYINCSFMLFLPAAVILIRANASGHWKYQLDNSPPNKEWSYFRRRNEPNTLGSCICSISIFSIYSCIFHNVLEFALMREKTAQHGSCLFFLPHNRYTKHH